MNPAPTALQRHIESHIGKMARQVAERDALNYVFGYTCGNDVNERD